MANISCRRRSLIFDYSISKTDIPLEGERRYLNGILTGIIHPCSVMGDGASQCDALPFLELIHIETAIDISLEILRINRNKVEIKNTHSGYIDIDLGVTGTEDLYRLKPGGKVEFIYDGLSWVNGVSDNSKNAIMNETGMYLISTFTGDDLYIYSSGDGKKWKSISGGESLFTDSTALRDPSIMFRNGKYWICYTNVGTGGIDHNEFKIISSEDLKTWTDVVTVDCSAVAGPPNVGARVWAPEWYVDNDGTVYIFVSIKPDAASDHTGYYLISQNEEMTSFSNPVIVSITGASAPTNWIDGFIIKVGSTYYLWYKDEVTKYVSYATSSLVTGPYVNQVTGDWAGWGANLEGQCVVKIDDTRYRIYLHDYPQDGLYYSESVDNFATWTAKVRCDETRTSTPFLLEHGTILKIDDFKIMADLVSSYLSRVNSFRGTVEIVNEGLLITDFNSGHRFLMDGVSYGHFIGTVTGDDTLYIDNRGSDPTIIRRYAGAAWYNALTILNSGNVGIGVDSPFGILHLRRDGSNIRPAIEEDAGTHNCTLRFRRGAIDWDVGQYNDDSFKIVRELSEGGEVIAATVSPTGNMGVMTETPTIVFSVSEKIGFSSEGGMCIKLTNRTGGASVKGRLVDYSSSYNNAVSYTSSGDVDCIGVFLESGIADGAEAWIVTEGLAYVAFDDNHGTTRGQWVGTGAIGYATSQASPPAAPTHFEEIGHCGETVAAGGAGTHILALCKIHPL